MGSLSAASPSAKLIKELIMMESKMMKTSGRGVAKAKMAKADMPAKGKMPAMKMGKVKTSSKPDGVVTKGKTKGAMIKMAKGGKACM